jgi:hypothetical protein
MILDLRVISTFSRAGSRRSIPSPSAPEDPQQASGCGATGFHPSDNAPPRSCQYHPAGARPVNRRSRTQRREFG